MSFFTSPAFGQMAGSLIGGLFGSKSAKRQGAMDRYAVDQMMRPFNLKEPFLRDLYGGSQGALNDALATGAFTGPTYAGLTVELVLRRTRKTFSTGHKAEHSTTRSTTPPAAHKQMQWSTQQCVTAPAG